MEPMSLMFGGLAFGAVVAMTLYLVAVLFHDHKKK